MLERTYASDQEKGYFTNTMKTQTLIVLFQLLLSLIESEQHFQCFGQQFLLYLRWHLTRTPPMVAVRRRRAAAPTTEPSTRRGEGASGEAVSGEWRLLITILVIKYRPEIKSSKRGELGRQDITLDLCEGGYYDFGAYCLVYYFITFIQQ